MNTAIATPRLRLRPFVPADAPRVAEICGDWRVASMCRVVPFPYSEADARFFLSEIATRADNFILAIEHESIVIGCVSLDGIREDGGGSTAALGYYLCADAWGRGVAKKAYRHLHTKPKSIFYLHAKSKFIYIVSLIVIPLQLLI